MDSDDPITRLETWMAEHPEEVAAIWARYERDEAAFDACDHDWQPDALGDPRHEQCARCSWGRFMPAQPDADSER